MSSNFHLCQRHFYNRILVLRVTYICKIFYGYHVNPKTRKIHMAIKKVSAARRLSTAHCFWALFEVHGCETVPFNKFWRNAEYFPKNIIPFPELLLNYGF